MKTSIRFVPLATWPTADRPNLRGRFRCSYGETLLLLDHELASIRAKNVIVQAFFGAGQLRGDGWPYANARPSESGVILSFTTSRGSFSFPCNRYLTYDDNLRAIALSLEALRAVDRYGVTQKAEQYQGWKQIEQATPGASFRTREDAARFVAIKAFGNDLNAGHVLINATARKLAYRNAAAALHPDNQNGGNHEEFVLLQKAMEILEKAA